MSHGMQANVCDKYNKKQECVVERKNICQIFVEIPLFLGFD